MFSTTAQVWALGGRRGRGELGGDLAVIAQYGASVCVVSSKVYKKVTKHVTVLR